VALVCHACQKCHIQPLENVFDTSPLRSQKSLPMDPQPIELQNKQSDLSIHPIHRNQPFQAETQLQETAAQGQESETRERVTVRRQQKVRANVQFFALCWTIFLMGWNDASTGPLVPRIREVYRVRGTLSEVFFLIIFLLPRLDSRLYP
jgi:hypothetical protein